MAIRYFTATTGNWSNASNWDNFSLSGIPGVGVNAGVSDDVYSNAKTVYIDTDINIGNGYIRNGNPGSPVLGVNGAFIVTANNVSITGNARNDSSSVNIFLIRNSGSTKTVNFFGTMIGSPLTSNNGNYVFDNYGTLNFSGFCVPIASNSQTPIIYNQPTGIISANSITITGTNGNYTIVDASTASTPSVYYINSVSSNCCYNKTSTSSAFIYGNFLLNGYNGSEFAPFFNNSGGGTLTISGNTGFTGATSGGTLTGSSAASRLVVNTNGTVNVYGDIRLQDVPVLRNSSTATGGMVHNISGTMNVYGNLYGLNVVPISNITGGGSCVFNESTGTINISANTISGGTSNGSNLTAFDGTSTNGGAIILNFVGGTINITANTISTSSGAYYVGVYNNTGNVIVTANTFNLGTGNNSHLFFNVSNATGTYTINSPTNGVNTRTTGVSGSGGGALLYNGGGPTSRINFVGSNLICGFGTNTTIWNNLTGTINVTGTSIIGGFGNGATINNVSSGNINISGITLISGGTSFSSTNAVLISNQNNGIVNVTLPDGVNSYFYGANGSGSHLIYTAGISTITNIYNPYSLTLYGGQTVSGSAISNVITYGGFNNYNPTINITGSGVTNIINNNYITGDDSTATTEPRGMAIGLYTGTINITGGTINITGGTGVRNHTIMTRFGTTATINLTGLKRLVINPTGTSINCFGVYNNGFSPINITADNADVYGGNGTSNHIIYNNNTGSTTINGIKNIYLGSGDTTYGIYNNGTTPINISGLTTISGSVGSGSVNVYNGNTSRININNQDVLNLIANQTISGNAVTVISSTVASGSVNITGSGVTNIINKNTLAGDTTTANIPTYGQAIGCYNGTINITGGTVNITGGTGSNNNCILVRAGSPGVVNITGLNSLIVNPSGTSSSCYGVFNNGTSGVINVSANNIDIYGGNGSSNHIIHMANSGLNTININGIRNMYLGSGTTSYSVYNNSTGTINITANTLTAYSGTSSHSVYNAVGGTINIAANNIINNGINNSYTIFNNSTGRINITSATTINAGSGLNAYTIVNNNIGQIYITATTISGNTYTPTNSRTPAIYSTTNGLIDIFADTIIGDSWHAVYSVGASSTNRIVVRNLINKSGWTACYFPYFSGATYGNSYIDTKPSTESLHLFQTTSNNTPVYYATSGYTGYTDYSSSLPLSGNVRNGVVYGSGTTTYTGSCFIPSSSNIIYGVPFTDTGGVLSTGTLSYMTPSEFGYVLALSGS